MKNSLVFLLLAFSSFSFGAENKDSYDFTSYDCTANDVRKGFVTFYNNGVKNDKNKITEKMIASVTEESKNRWHVACRFKFNRSADGVIHSGVLFLTEYPDHFGYAAYIADHN